MLYRIASLFSKRLEPEAAIPEPEAVIGYVESITPMVISGWAIHRHGVPLQISLHSNDSDIILHANWVERSDVALQYGENHIHSGFRCELPIDLSYHLQNLIDNNMPIRVLANGIVLNFLDDDIFRSAARRENIDLKVENSLFSVEIISWGHFSMYGSVVNDDEESHEISLICNGRRLDCSVIRSLSAFDLDALGAKENKDYLEIELPGYLWECVDAGGDARLQLVIDGHSINHEPILLDRAKALSWITEIALMENCAKKDVLAMQALEHIRYGNMFGELEREPARYFSDFAERMRLQDFLHPRDNGSDVGALSAPMDASAESFSTLLLWRALRELNLRVKDRDQPVFDHVRSVINVLKLKDEALESFLISVVPLLCHSGEFLRLRELIEFGKLQRLENSATLWEMTLCTPAMIADGHVARATNVLYRAAENLSSGWLNTECIRYSVLLLQHMEAGGRVEIAVAEKFRYAVIGLLDAFKGEWFSRLHDRNLIDSMILLLADIDRYTDYFRRDVIAAAQRIYGLNPTFWRRAVERGIPSKDRELTRGHAHFHKLHHAFETGCKIPAEWLEEIAEPLAYYRSKTNPEAVIYLREICANLLPAFNESLPVRAKALLSKLLATDPAEAMRIAAFPLPTENHLLDTFPETEPGILRETLRKSSDPDKSVAWHMQENASAALRALFDCESGDKKNLTQALDALEQHAITLANWQGGFLAFDLLASGYTFASEHCIENMPLISRMSDILKKAVKETKADWFLPAPVLAGLNRLISVTSGNFGLQGFLTESRNLIRAKFGTRMDDLLDPLMQPQLRIAQNGWPQDTLVVIYSCKKYLDTRVKTIRETWVQDLKARGIPYLVLVGDGDDVITDDVLALDVSDKYEDLPRKSLKLFDWVYRNTDAQYVLKIDDDCYLDVARFFDTLSYRKYYYYGRVIRRGIGSMDRAWHQPKSSTPFARKSLDKSPEPSVYADGGGGYTLSRLAIQQLLKNEKTFQGERLKACSFMEDKLVGDLLAMSHIEPSNEDYDSYQRRRTFGEAMPVGMVENGFFPCQATPTKVVHLDRDLDMAPTHATVTSRELWPKKLWPTCWSPSIKHNSNQLELLSDVNKADTLLSQKVFVISVVRNEIIMLPHFLAHYRALGVESFIFVDNCSDDGSREYLFAQPDVIIYSADTEYKYSHYGVAWQQAVLGNLCLGKWVLLADADELLVYENFETIPIQDFLIGVEAEGANAVRTDMIDMYPYGDLADADFSRVAPFSAAPWFDAEPLIPWRLGSGMYSSGPTYLSSLRNRLAQPSAPNSFTSQKYGLIRYQPWVRYSQGLHDAANMKVSDRPAWFAHFKYHSGFKEKVETEIRRGQHFNNAAEYRRYAAMLVEGQGGFGKDGLSIKYNGSQSFSGLVE